MAPRNRAAARIVRISVAALFLAAALFALLLPVPKHPFLPSVALGQAGVYRLEVCLVVVYGGLLLLTPLFYGVLEGKLPNEISHRGARWPTAAGEAIATLQTSVSDLQDDSTDLRGEFIKQQLLDPDIGRTTENPR